MLIPPYHVRPWVKGNGCDASDIEACCGRCSAPACALPREGHGKQGVMKARGHAEIPVAPGIGFVRLSARLRMSGAL